MHLSSSGRPRPLLPALFLGRFSLGYVALLSATLLFSTSALAKAPDYEKLAGEVARLRTEVETLSERIEDEKQETRSRLRALSGQKNSLEAEIQREELRVKQIEQELRRVKEQVRQAGELQREIEPAVLEAAAALERPIAAGLPFKVEQRLEDLRKIPAELREDVIAPGTAVARLWSIVEDELRLLRENGMYTQRITLEGEEVLVDVARVGMAMLFFRTPDERFGYARKTPSGWTYELLDNQLTQEKVEAYFASLERRVRVGFFELPNALQKESPR